MTARYPTLIPESFHSSGAASAYSVDAHPLLECDDLNGSFSSALSDSSSFHKCKNSDSNKCWAVLATLSSLGLLVVLGLQYQQQSLPLSLHDGWIPELLPHKSKDNDGSYGLDVSWPIHGPLNGRNVNPSPFAPGARHEAYLEQLEGCRNYYRQRSLAAARTCDTYEFDRLLMNKRQPQSMENYTDVGFQKIRAPPKMVRLVEEFWTQNKDKQVPEVWPEGNIYLNHWDAPSYMVSVDDMGLRGSGYNLKRQIWSAAQTTISEWTGGQDITPVSMYGIRVYTNGSLLVPHVDRLPLVASAMINVAQDVEEDWPMEIYSHDGRAHNVTLQPGDMLLFESHSVLHGRPFPLKGKYYAMLFIHFEPTGTTPLLREPPTSLEDQYRQAVQDGVGGQSSSEQNSLLPPYIRRFSPEEEHWQREHPEGWQSPAAHPASIYLSADEEDKEDDEYPNTDENQESQQQQQKKKSQQPEGHQAARDGDLQYWKTAIDKTKGSEEQIYSLVNQRDFYGWQPIHEAAANGKEAVVDLLLENGANINARTNGGRGGTPLFLAQQTLGSQHRIVRYLTDRGALSIPPDNFFRDEL